MGQFVMLHSALVVVVPSSSTMMKATMKALCFLILLVVHGGLISFSSIMHNRVPRCDYLYLVACRWSSCGGPARARSSREAAGELQAAGFRRLVRRCRQPPKNREELALPLRHVLQQSRNRPLVRWHGAVRFRRYVGSSESFLLLFITICVIAWS